MKKKVKQDYLEFKPDWYLQEYYSSVGEENAQLMSFHYEAHQRINRINPRVKLLVELGGGPTIYQLIAAAKHPIEIHFTDLLAQNLEHVQRWVQNHPEAHNWKPFFEYSSRIEGDKAETHSISRQDSLRSKIKKITIANIKKKHPLGEENHQKYDIVCTNFVLEAISRKKAEWKKYLSNCVGLIKPGGFIIITSVTQANHYHVGKDKFITTKVDKEDFKKQFKKLELEIDLEKEILAEANQGYHGIYMVLARKIPEKNNRPK